MESFLPQHDVNQALQYIAAIEAQIHATGAVDSEPGSIQAIRNSLTKGAITPEQAIARVQSLADSRQDYH